MLCMKYDPTLTPRVLESIICVLQLSNTVLMSDGILHNEEVELNYVRNSHVHRSLEQTKDTLQAILKKSAPNMSRSHLIAVAQDFHWPEIWRVTAGEFKIGNLRERWKSIALLKPTFLQGQSLPLPSCQGARRSSKPVQQGEYQSCRGDMDMEKSCDGQVLCYLNLEFCRKEK